MPIITSTSRLQTTFSCLEDHIDKDNTVRFIDAFVEHLDLPKLHFEQRSIKAEGRPSFEPKLFLKIYLYGYLNSIRSSRRLEKECTRNIELQWLCSSLRPNYHSIADFRKINPAALKNTFKLFVLFLKDAGLIGGTTIAIDGTKVRAHNSKKSNYSQKKIERHIAYIEDKTNEYLNQLDSNDQNEDVTKISHIQEKIARLKANKIAYELLQDKLIASGETQISTTDADARALLVQGQVVEVSYNVQAAVDDKHKLVVATHTINRNDRNALYAIATETQENIAEKNFTALVDKGYHNGRQLQQTQAAGITTLVAAPTLVNSNEYGTTQAYMADQFRYTKETDSYTCPAGETLHTTGTWHKKTRERDSYLFKKYRTPTCKTCPVKHLCTGKEKGGREIDRSEFAEAVQTNNQHYKNNPALYRKRQEINEHIFGTIKRKWGYNHTNLIGLEKVNGEFAFIMLVYNIKRTINILGIAELIAKLKNWTPKYPNGSPFSFFRRLLELFYAFQIYAPKYRY